MLLLYPGELYRLLGASSFYNQECLKIVFKNYLKMTTEHYTFLLLMMQSFIKIGQELHSGLFCEKL